MRSRAEVRRSAEWALRIALVAMLAVALWRAFRPADAASAVRGVAASKLGRELGAIIQSPDVRAADVSVDAMPTRADRDALVALRRAGVTVRWNGKPPALAVEALRVREPDARARVLVSARGAGRLALTDSAGLLDSVRADAGATVEASSVVGSVRASQGAFAAAARAPEPRRRGAVLVLGGADWESRFVIQALSEAGWDTRARIPAAPEVVVHDDALQPIDTARYDAVVALDTTAADLAPAIARFVAQGGGLVAVGDALGIEAIRALAPARAGERRVGRILLAEDTVTPRDLPIRPLAVSRPDALPIERDARELAVAARRAGLGRVIAVGYDESWRWRMLGGTSGLDAHRRFWSRAVGSVAPDREGAVQPNADAAPLAALHDALGGPSAAVASATMRATNALPLVLLALIVATLLAEIASRRFRGER